MTRQPPNIPLENNRKIEIRTTISPLEVTAGGCGIKLLHWIFVGEAIPLSIDLERDYENG